MALYMILILALVQGITEFLPISSSGHLVLVHAFVDPPVTPAQFKQNLIMDVAVHVGTLLSVLVYFRRDVLRMAHGATDILTGKIKSEGARLDFYVVVSSIPVIVVGFILNYFDIYWTHIIQIIGWTTLIFGVLLWWVDAKKPETKNLNQMNMKDALFIGLAQAVALVPGTSRSGITMTAARYVGYTRPESAHYSLLLAIIAIAGAGTLTGISLIKMGDVSLGLDAALAALLAFVAGWGAIALMMAWLERASFKVFAIYRIMLGVLLLVISYGGFVLAP